MKTSFSALLLLLGPTLAAFATEPLPEGTAFFEQKIRPLLVEHCYECHSTDAKKLKGHLFLDSKAGWQVGGDSGGPVIILGKPEESLLIKSVRHEDPDTAMPPKKSRLPDGAIADLVTWIRMGAPDPREGTSKVEPKRADKSWWSLQPLETAFSHDSIDGFIEEQLAQKGLRLNPPAEPQALIRRMTYDLTGLPPTQDELDGFLAAYKTDPGRAVETLVDRLLASPRYGEHWGRHWLDVVRFGESTGFERNIAINDLWPFRDYVIRSFNADKPFNQFITEHLAGDVLGKDNPEIEVASAFLVAGPYDDVVNQDVVAQKNIRAATLDDVITATASSFLGLTVNCARCHNHKFDPISTEDYYRLRAAFEGVTHGSSTVATREERDAFTNATKPLLSRKEQLMVEKNALSQAIEAQAKLVAESHHYTRPKIDPDYTEERFAPVQARFVKFVMLGNTTDPKNAATGGRLTEFEVWSAEAEPRNVALSRSGARAEGARSASAEDFPEAYGPQLCIDGKLGEQWFIGSPAELTITLAKTETIGRIGFSNSKGKGLVDKNKGATPCEYTVQTSLDGSTWQTVATSFEREPWSPAHGIARALQEATTAEQARKRDGLAVELARVQKQLDAVPKLHEVWIGKRTLVPEATFVHKGGDPTKPLAQVRAASLDVLDRTTQPYALPVDAPEGERRLALGRWITSNDNPLSPRVLVNRVWHYHFGTGLVDTPSDFGFLGSRPTHPALLDFLAQRLIHHGWQLKPLHREILLSRVYLQSAEFRPEAARADKDARLLWRFPPRRLSAEEVRDTLLSVAGKMQCEPMGGPGFRLYKFTRNNVCTYFPLDQHGPETFRRAVYHQNARASVVDVLTDFDLPDTAFGAPKRANTTSPLQALTLFNHSFTLNMAKALAERLQESDPVSRAYALVFQRVPSVQERAAAERLVASFGTEALCRALLNANELLFVE